MPRSQKSKRNVIHTVNEIKQKQAALEQSYDEQIAAQLDPVIKEGQKLEKKLQDQKGKPAKKALVFEVTGDTIVEVGIEIAAKHISQVQKVVKKKLEEIENELKDQKTQEIEELKTEAARVKAEADEEMEVLRGQLEDQSTASHNQNSRVRDELIELRPFTFLSEVRYRELKQRWGQVFRADMGAESFYDILRRLDLDKLSEELWKEVRTTKSKQKRKKATTRLKVVEAFRRSGNRPEWMILICFTGHPA